MIGAGKVYLVEIYSKNIPYVANGVSISSGLTIKKIRELIGDYKTLQGHGVGASLIFPNIRNVVLVTNCELDIMVKKDSISDSCVIEKMRLVGY